jgi:hypothetical protein
VRRHHDLLKWVCSAALPIARVATRVHLHCAAA